MQENPKLPRRVRVERGVYQNPSTGRFEIQFTDSGGRVRWRTIGPSLSEARVARTEAKLGYLHGGRVIRSRRTFADVAEEWLAAQTHLRPRTAALYGTALDRHLFPRIGERRIAAVDEDVIAQIVAQLHAQGLAGWTIRGILVPLGRVLAYAARRKLIPDNPMRRLDRSERPRVVRREMRILRPEEIDALLRASPPGYRPIIATAIFTGLRQGELLGLRWADVDFDGGVVNVRRRLDRNGAYAEPKTPRALRSVVLMPSLAALLRKYRACASYAGPQDPVFATATGRAMHYRNVTRRGLAVAKVRAGIDRDGEPRLRFHDLRHGFASLLISQGLNIVFVSRQLGHSSPSMTLDVYGGLFDQAEHARRAADGLEAAFASTLIR